MWNHRGEARSPAPAGGVGWHPARPLSSSIPHPPAAQRSAIHGAAQLNCRSSGSRRCPVGSRLQCSPPYLQGGPLASVPFPQSCLASPGRPLASLASPGFPAPCAIHGCWRGAPSGLRRVPAAAHLLVGAFFGPWLRRVPAAAGSGRQIRRSDLKIPHSALKICPGAPALLRSGWQAFRRRRGSRPCLFLVLPSSGAAEGGTGTPRKNSA
jgi:hypothetical protein